jgi:hypothetical protein
MLHAHPNKKFLKNSRNIEMLIMQMDAELEEIPKI